MYVCLCILHTFHQVDSICLSKFLKLQKINFGPSLDAIWWYLLMVFDPFSKGALRAGTSFCGWSIKPYTSGCVPDPLCSSTSHQCSLSEPQPSIAKHSAFWQVEKLDPLHFRKKIAQNCHMEPQKMASSHISAESIWNLIEVKPESSIGSDMSWLFLVIILSLHHWHGCGNLNFTSPSHHHKWIT
jgi:hypothetical protein